MISPTFLARVGLGVAATAAEQAVAVPVRTVSAIASLPTLPVRLAGDAVQAYLHAGQQVTDLAIKGDRVLATLFPVRSEQPDWVTFDEDVPTDEDDAPPVVYGLDNTAGAASDSEHATTTADAPDAPGVPTGRVRGRRQ